MSLSVFFFTAEATFSQLQAKCIWLCVLCVFFQDWEFPHFMGDLDMNLPGMSTTHVKVKLPVCKRIFKEEYHIHITGTGRQRVLQTKNRVILLFHEDTSSFPE